MALLVLFARATRAGIVASDFRFVAHKGCGLRRYFLSGFTIHITGERTDFRVLKLHLLARLFFATLLLNLLQLVLAANLDVCEVSHHIALQRIEHAFKQFKRFTLVRSEEHTSELQSRE